MEEVAKSFGISFETLRKRATRKEWNTPARVAKLAQLQKETRQQVALSQGVPNAPNSTEIVANSLAQNGEKLRTVALRLSLNALEKVDVEKMPIKSWSDAATVFGMGAKAAGIDATAGPTVSILFGMDSFGYSDANSSVQEVEVIEDSGEGV